MATDRKKPTRKNKRMTVIIYLFLAFLILLGGVLGFIIAKRTIPVKTITVTETVEVPAYESDTLIEPADVFLFNVPLSNSLQRYIYEICADKSVPATLVMAMIEHESQFNPEIISDTNDYGLMQINGNNLYWLEEQHHTADMLNPYQNVYCGISIIGKYLEKYGDYGKALMAYNMGDYGAQKAWADGFESSRYSESILSLIPRLERLFLATPQKDYAVIMQSIGRIARTFEGKERPIAYDFVDNIPYLVRSYKKRCTTYRKNGCYILE